MYRHKITVIFALFLILKVCTVQAALQSRAGGTLIYDTDLNITWVADARLFKTELAKDPNLVDKIIANVVTVPSLTGISHTLTRNDFDTEGGKVDNELARTEIGMMTWWGATAWANNLEYGDITGWRVAGGGEMYHLIYEEFQRDGNLPLSESHNAYYDLFVNIPVTGPFWHGEATVEDGYEYTWRMWVDGISISSYLDSYAYAWAYHPGDIAPVPAPAAIWLFGSGLFSIALLRKRFT